MDCPIDNCPNEICGGPHVEVYTDLGWEVIKEGQPTVGSILVPTDAEVAARRELMDPIRAQRKIVYDELVEE